MSERMHILEAVESGEMSVEEAVRRLEASAKQPEEEKARVTPPGLARRLCLAVFWSGVVLTTGGGLLLTSHYARETGPGSLACGWLFLVLGTLVVTLGTWMQSAHWFTLRVRRHSGPHVTLALPLPLGLAAWVLRTARPFIPQLEHTSLDELIMALQEELDDGRPLFLDVNERDGERMRVTFS